MRVNSLTPVMVGLALVSGSVVAEQLPAREQSLPFSCATTLNNGQEFRACLRTAFDLSVLGGGHQCLSGYGMLPHLWRCG